jgi:mannonate dehydratase
MPVEEVWETGPYLRFVPRMMDAVRERFGFEVDGAAPAAR